MQNVERIRYEVAFHKDVCGYPNTRFGLCLDPVHFGKQNKGVSNFPAVPVRSLCLYSNNWVFKCVFGPLLVMCTKALGYLRGILTSSYKQKPADCFPSSLMYL